MIHNFDTKLEKVLDDEYGWEASRRLMDEDYSYMADKYREHIAEMYDECENCLEEYTSDELMQDEIGGRYYEQICQNCVDKYNELMEEYLDNARQKLDEDWYNGRV